MDKVNLICLTDGEPNSKFSNYYNGTNEDGKQLQYGRLSFRLADHVIFDDPISRKKYDLIHIMKKDQASGNWRDTQETQVVFLLDLLKDRYGVNCIGIFLNSGNTVARRLLEKYVGGSATIGKPIRKFDKGYAKMDLRLSIMRVGMSTTSCPPAK